jgi:hypothetical protein
MGAFYSNTVAHFISDDNHLIIGALTTKAATAGFYQQKHTQTLSYDEEINILKSSFAQLITDNPNASEYGILLEYPIARRDKRIDAVIITNNLIIVVEFKVGKLEYSGADKEQLLDYCLDLRDFHFESREKTIIPILLATEGGNPTNNILKSDDFVQNIILANTSNLFEKLKYVIINWGNNDHILNYSKWTIVIILLHQQ